MGIIKREFEMPKKDFDRFLSIATFGYSGYELGPEDAKTSGVTEETKQQILRALFRKVRLFFYRRITDGKRLVLLVEDLGENYKVIMVEDERDSSDEVFNDVN